MTLARSQQISLDHTPYYHCTSRCVRRAFLCGKDRYSGKSFEHRRVWLEERLKALSALFAIDLLAYAVMSNHYHVVVRLNSEQALSWTDEEVLERWQQLYSLAGDTKEQIAIYRHRLESLSWFMRAINEPIARRANREDRCKGRFWEGRFKSQALLDETALLKCMAYVDLNPIRAGMARTPESSRHTSVRARVTGDDRHLLPFGATSRADEETIPINQKDYLVLLDWSGRALRPGKRGAIPGTTPDILSRLGLASEPWLNEMQHYGKWYYRAVGSAQALRHYCEHLGQQWLKGIGHTKVRHACA